MTAGFAANYLTATMVCFFIGRFTGTWLIRRFAPHNVLAIYAFIAMLLCLLSAFSGGHVGLLALTLCSAFMSIQYPTIFSLGIKHLGQDTKYGSSFIVMTIIGGGIVTPGDGLCQRRRRQYPDRRTGPGAVLRHHLYFCPFPFTSGDELNLLSA
ncbi:L-fucose transporter [Klebsiella pneumoniae]|uniref:L-fucose transporter n=1 Tax=Klebsiella pneumoniae TaxID=573 RepID=A0A447RPY3_KLEPN|nr:L-fucose transporter [Klebsiella pneumoniae]